MQSTSLSQDSFPIHGVGFTGLQAQRASKALANRKVAIIERHQTSRTSLVVCLGVAFLFAMATYFFNLIWGNNPVERTLPPCLRYGEEDYCLNVKWRSFDRGGSIAAGYEGTLLAFFTALKVGYYYWQRKGWKAETNALLQCESKLQEHPLHEFMPLSPSHAAVAFPHLDAASYQDLDAKHLRACRSRHPELFRQKLNESCFSPAQQGLFRWLASFDAATSLSSTSQKALQHWCSKNPEIYTVLLQELGSSIHENKDQLKFFRELLTQGCDVAGKKSQLNAIIKNIIEGEELSHAINEVLHPDEYGKVTLSIADLELQAPKYLAARISIWLESSSPEELERVTLQEWQQFIIFLKTNTFEPEQYYGSLKAAYALHLEKIFAEHQDVTEDLIIEDDSPYQGPTFHKTKVDDYLSLHDYHFENVPSCDASEFITKYQIAKKYDLPKALEICQQRFHHDMAELQKIHFANAFYTKAFACHKMLKELESQDPLWQEFVTNCEQWLNNHAYDLQALWQCLEFSAFSFLEEQIKTAVAKKPSLLHGWPTPPEELLHSNISMQERVKVKKEEDEEAIEFF